CAVYTKLNPTVPSAKTRTYRTVNGVLFSHSDLQGQPQKWESTAEGVEASFDNFNGCGKFITKNFMRLTGAANLMSEVVLNLNDYLDLCESADYDREAVRAVELNETYPSQINDAYVVNSYEFCRPTN